jgi:hypothetical protein
VKRPPVETVAMIVVAVVVAALAVTRTQLTPATARSASTHFSGDGGMRALFLTARELGIPVSRWQRPLHACRHCRAFAVIAPARPLTAVEAKLLRKRLKRGARMLYVPAPFRDDLLAMLGLTVEPTADATVGFRHAGSSPLLEGTPSRVDGFRRVVVPGSTPHDVVVEPLLVRGRKRLAAARVTIGDGEMIVIADTAPLGNRVLRTGGVAPLALRALASIAGNGDVAFDEFHHGFDDGVGLFRTSVRWLTSTAPGWALLQLGIVAVLAIAAAGVRLGSAQEPAIASRRSPLEHADALAAAYAKARASRRAAALLVDELRLRLGVRTPSGLRARLEAIAVTRPTLRAAVAEVLGHGGADPDLPRLARAIDQLTEEPHAVRS